MIGTATFVMLIAATAIADNAYPPCTQQRTDKCSAQQQAPGPTLYIPWLKENTARHTISSAKRGSGEPLTAGFAVDPPPPGGWCSSCYGAGWWTERHEPKGRRSVTTHYRYKRPPRKRKAVALEAPAIVTAKSSHRPRLAGGAAAEVSATTRRDDGPGQIGRGPADPTQR
jgi:hypothetical protein